MEFKKNKRRVKENARKYNKIMNEVDRCLKNYSDPDLDKIHEKCDNVGKTKNKVKKLVRK